MADPEWTTQDDVRAYAEYVANKVAWDFDYARNVTLPEMLTAMRHCTEAVADLAAAFRASEINDMVNHPELAELDVQLKGFYGDD